MKVCMGIVSYLPDDERVREVRVKRLNHLLNQCKRLYGLPVLIIAQNWREGEVELTPSCRVFHYPKLGITGARKTLRQVFLTLDFDYIILLDDDMELLESAEQAKYYLKWIASNPTTALEYQNYLLNMFGMPRDLWEKYDFDDIDPERGEGFEDWIFVEKIKKTGRYKKISDLILLAHARKDLVKDPYSTGITEKTDKGELTRKSRQIIDQGKKPSPSIKSTLFS